MKRRFYVLSLICIATVAAIVWSGLDGERRARLNELVQHTADGQARALHRDMAIRIAAARGLGDMWRPRVQPTADAFAARARAYMDQFAGLRAVSYADPDFVARFVEPSANSRALGRNIAEFGPERRQALEAARDENRVTVSDPVELVSGKGLGFLTFIPLRFNDAFQGTILVVIRGQSWLDNLLLDVQGDGVTADFATRITLAGKLLYQATDFDTLDSSYHSSPAIDFQGKPLQVTLRPRPAFVAANRGHVPEYVALGTAFLLLLALLAIGQALRARQAERQVSAANRTLLTTNRTLRHEVDYRTRAETDAQNARRAASRFLATMSHEIRTPLNAIMGMFQLIENARDLPDRQKRQARAGFGASMRLFGELSNVLDVSRLDAGALVMASHDTELAPMIDTWRDTLNALLIRAEKHLEIRFDVAPDLPDIVHVDPGRITQVVTNLMHNAVKFTARGKVAVQVMRDAADIRVTVTDSGVGIAAARQDDIFRRFYQIETGPDRGFEGSGLGLAISSEMAALMDAQLTLDHSHTAGEGAGPTGSSFALRFAVAPHQRTEIAA